MSATNWARSLRLIRLWSGTNLPPGVFGPFVNDEYSDVSFALYALKASGMPLRELARQAEVIRQGLLPVPGVKKINIIGGRPEKILFEFSYAKLATLGVSAQDIIAALQRQPTSEPAGTGGAAPRLQIGCESPISASEPSTAGGRRNRMKNPFMSLWLSNTNRALGAGRGMVTAEMRRQQSAAAKSAMRAAGLGGTAKPKKKRPAKRKAS